MSISYTKRGWTNNSPPAINAANLGAMDDGIKQACDGVDQLTQAPVAHANSHKHGGADEIATATPAPNAIPKADTNSKLDAWVSDASESTAGKVQLASTTPAALGTAAKGSATTAAKADHVHQMPTLDEIGEGTTYNRVQAAKATALNNGDVSAYVPDASTSAKGKVQLATAAELETGTDASKVLTPAVVRGATMKRSVGPDGAPVYVSNFTSSTDGWSSGVASLSYSDGVLRMVANTDLLIIKTLTVTAGQYAYLIVRGSRTSFNLVVWVSGYYMIVNCATSQTEWNVVQLPIISSGSSISIQVYGAVSSGEWLEFKNITIGSYSYLPGTLSEEAARIVNQLVDTTGLGAKATTTLTSNGTNVSNGNTVTLAGKVYTFKTALTPAEGEVLIGAAYTDSLDNLVAAITGGAGNGTLYSCEAAHPLVTASRNGAVVTITALQAGILGNQITTSKSAATLTLANPAGGTTTLAGGVDNWGAKAKAQLGAALGAGAQVGALPNRTNSNIIGYFDVVDCASGAQVTLPAGGTWAWMVETYGATYNGVKCGTAAGGAAITGTASANLTMYYERIA